MEDKATNARPAEQARFPTIDRILGALVGLVIGNRRTLDARGELDQCEPSEVAQIAHDLSVTPEELKVLAGKSPASAIDQLLAALGVDRPRRPFSEPALVRDLQRLCSACVFKRQCGRELATGTAAAHYRTYCPNAYTLDYMIGRGR
jgi:hypothetical protein